MKQYLAFAGESFYPAGGWDDLVGTFGTLNDAIDAVVPKHVIGPCGWWGHVVDGATGKRVYEWKYVLSAHDRDYYNRMRASWGLGPLEE